MAQRNTFQSKCLISSGYPNFVDDGGGKYLLSKGILPSSTIMRHDVQMLTDNWNDVENRHRELQRQLDAVERDLSRHEDSLMKQTSNSLSRSKNGRSPVKDTNVKFVNNSVTKPGSHICGSGFKWAGTTTNGHKRDYGKPRKIFDDPVVKHKAKIQTEYGTYTKECDLPEPLIHVNKTAPFHYKCTMTKDELQQRMNYFEKE